MKPAIIRPFCGVSILLLLIIAAPVVYAEGRGKAPWIGETLDGRQCTGRDTGNFGPFDFRLDKDRLPVVENHHFTAEVEQLRGGSTAPHAIGDIHYTLTKIPNHHRALYSAVRFSLSEPSEALRRRNPAECFLQRAIAYAPDDPIPHMLYGLYLHRLGKASDSLSFYNEAEKLAPNDPNLLYNMGLVYLDLKQYEAAQAYAKRAYASGIGLPGLQRKLQQAGHWN